MSTKTADQGEPLYYLLSLNHENESLLWWRPNRQGYTTNLERAGKYTKADAESTTRGHASDVLAILCADADERSIRTVSVEHVGKFRELARVCHNDRCDDTADEGQTICRKCQEGEKGPVHLGRGDGYTWCGKVVSDAGTRTYGEREPVVCTWFPGSKRDVEKVTCAECKTKGEKARVDRLELHQEDCTEYERPYCEGCRECNSCGQLVGFCRCVKLAAYDDEP